MSQALRVAILGKIEASPIAKLVGLDPNDGVNPAIFNGRKNQAPPVYPCLTYRLTGDAPDKRFRGDVGSSLSGRIYDMVLEAEYWTDVADSGPQDAVKATLRTLFDNVAFDVPEFTGDYGTDPGGRVISTVCSTAQTDHYDNKLNCWFGLFRFHMRYQLA